MSEQSREKHRVVIVGGGFGGLYAAQALRSPAVAVTLVDRRNFHLFQPLLYQVATGGLSPADIAHPLRSILKRRRNVSVLLAEVVDFDLAEKRLQLADGELAYDSLIVAAGAVNHYFGHDDWEKRAPGLKSIEEATEIRSRILVAFEAAEREKDAELRRAWLTFGTGSGYLTACLARLAEHVVSVDIYADFKYATERKLAGQGIDNVELHVEDAAAGSGAEAHFDAIAVTGSLPVLHQGFHRSLNIGGRLFVIVGQPPMMEALLITRVGADQWAQESLFDTVIPPLLNAATPTGFRF